MPGTAARMRVLQSYALAPSSNPYVTQLLTALQQRPDVDVVQFGWRVALTTRVDVFHVHWAEALIERRGRFNTYARRVLYLVLLLKLRLTRAPVVRTLHNLELPQGMGRVCNALLRLTERWTTLWIAINSVTERPGAATEVILHGHYRDWFAEYPQPEKVTGRALFFGRIRRYKNVPGLIAAFGDLPADDGYTLHVCGRPSTEEYARHLVDLVAGDARISVTTRHMSDAELAEEIGQAHLVVLPYPEMHNSGSVLAALSLGTAVLVPDNAVNRALRDEVGAQWLTLFQGTLGAEHLAAAMTDAPATGTQPDLGLRDWPAAGEAHERAYRRALSLRRGRAGRAG